MYYNNGNNSYNKNNPYGHNNGRMNNRPSQQSNPGSGRSPQTSDESRRVYPTSRGKNNRDSWTQQNPKKMEETEGKESSSAVPDHWKQKNAKTGGSSTRRAGAVSEVPEKWKQQQGKIDDSGGDRNLRGSRRQSSRNRRSSVESQDVLMNDIFDQRYSPAAQLERQRTQEVERQRTQEMGNARRSTANDSSYAARPFVQDPAAAKIAADAQQTTAATNRTVQPKRGVTIQDPAAEKIARMNAAGPSGDNDDDDSESSEQFLTELMNQVSVGYSAASQGSAKPPAYKDPTDPYDNLSLLEDPGDHQAPNHSARRAHSPPRTRQVPPRRGISSAPSARTYATRGTYASEVIAPPMATAQDVFQPGAFQVSDTGIRVNAKGRLTELPTQPKQSFRGSLQKSFRTSRQPSSGIMRPIGNILQRISSISSIGHPPVAERDFEDQHQHQHHQQPQQQYPDHHQHQQGRANGSESYNPPIHNQERPQEDQPDKRTTLCRCGIAILCCLGAMAAVGVPVALALTKEDSPDGGNVLVDDPPPPPPPSEEDEPAIGERLEALLTMLEDGGIVSEGFTENYLLMTNEPQALAANWLASTDPANLDFEMTALDDVAQRYRVATFFFSADTRLQQEVEDVSYEFPALVESSECDWNDGGNRGVFCNDEGMVTRVSIVQEGLDGEIPSELFLLPSLDTLRLGFNSLRGTLPAEFGASSALVELDLDSNAALDIALPDDLSQISSLEVLNLGGTGLNPTIPASIGNLTALETLDLSGNSFLGGTLPTEIGLLQELTILKLGSTSLESSIPSELGMLEKLKELTLDNTNLDGRIPAELANLTNLETFLLSQTNIIDDLVLQQLCSNDVIFMYYAVCQRQVLCSCCTQEAC